MPSDFLVHTLLFLKSEFEKGTLQFILITIAWNDIDLAPPKIKERIFESLYNIGHENETYQ